MVDGYRRIRRCCQVGGVFGCLKIGAGFLLSKFSDHFDPCFLVHIVAGEEYFFEPVFVPKRIVFKKREHLDGFQVWNFEAIFNKLNILAFIYVCGGRNK